MSLKKSEESASMLVACPVCDKKFEQNVVEDHVNKCLFLNTTEKSTNIKRSSSHLNTVSPNEKRLKIENSPTSSKVSSPATPRTSKKASAGTVPLAEQMRPLNLDDIVGQHQVFGPGSMLRSLLEQKKIPNMILWGPPGCGKTSLANVVANICKEQNNMRFVKLSATMSGINDVKEVVKIAKNEAQFKRNTVLFMDEIHRFNKLQQDTFLPHVENGTITLIGATTENPSFSLNNALLSRCRVIVMEKLSIDEVLVILKRALEKRNCAMIVNNVDISKTFTDDNLPKCLIEEASLTWLAGICDGDARVALGALELALSARNIETELHESGPAILTLDDIKDGIKRTHMLYDRQGEEHYNTISAVHKSIRAGDENASLYWVTRALHGGEDPLYIARRLVRAACEDIGSDMASVPLLESTNQIENDSFDAALPSTSRGLADSSALVEAVACLQGCQQIGMPECDVLLAQCAVRLARAPKSRRVYRAMTKCKQLLNDTKGPHPPIPLHLRNAPTKLMKQLGYATGYNLRHKDESGLTYMPEGLEDIDFLNSDGEDFGET